MVGMTAAMATQGAGTGKLYPVRIQFGRTLGSVHNVRLSCRV